MGKNPNQLQSAEILAQEEPESPWLRFSFPQQFLTLLCTELILLASMNWRATELVMLSAIWRDRERTKRKVVQNEICV